MRGLGACPLDGKIIRAFAPQAKVFTLLRLYLVARDQRVSIS
jgi:hypothetical protein